MGEPGLTRERDDARGLVELFQPPENLCLLEGEALRREGRIGRLDARRADVVQPAAERDGAFGADIAPIQVFRPVAGRERLDESALGKVSATKNAITEPHDSSSCPTPQPPRRRRAGPADDGWRERDEHEPSIR